MRANPSLPDHLVTEQAPSQTWTQILNRYRTPSVRRGAFELAITALPLAALWVADWLLFANGYWWASLLLAIPAAGFLVRLFMIQHDCGHGAFLPNRRANDLVGRIIGVVTLTPYDFWKRSHAIHHSTSGNLDRRGMGDVEMLTVDEYLARSRLGRMKYRLFRHPLVMFGLGPAYIFLIQQRLPVGFMREGWRPWAVTQANNVVLAVIAAALIWLIGPKAFFLVHLPVMLFAATAGVWLFYVQHQFGESHWTNGADWSFHDAALRGSSYYDLPWILRWFTANIGVHHVHHIASRIPYYRLPDVLRDHPDLRKIGRITLGESLRCVRLKLWDERQAHLVSFREARRSRND